ncbi:MAG: hypothetical protein PHW82_17415 [Bacteroidales bacterium]|nr:hypothetical protein [Bacteroidales bacterium]
MKNLKFIVLIGLFTSFVLSCAKEEVNTPQNTFNNDSEVLIQNKDVGGELGPWRIFHNIYGIAFCCEPAYNCFPVDIYIYAEHASTVDQIFNSIKKGDRKLTEQLIYENKKMLVGYYSVDAKYIDGFLKGVYSLESAENFDSGFSYLRFVDRSGSDVCVYPMKWPRP